MQQVGFRALTVAALLAGLAGCTTGSPVTSFPTPGPGASAAPGTTPSAPPSPAVTQKAGAASEAYAKAVAELKAKGVTAWSLYRIQGNPVSTTGLATESGHTWQVFFYTPTDGKSWRASVLPGIGASLNEVTQADQKWAAGQDISTADWAIDSDAAVTAAGGSTSGTVYLQKQSEAFPVWIINRGAQGQVRVNAKTGAKL